METKPLLYGLIGFFAGGLLVATAATMMNTPNGQVSINNQADEMSMSEMTATLRNKTGDNYDAAFISYMIDHHEAAVDMAKLSADKAKHKEVKDLSLAIISAQENEITQMKQWQKDWGYISTSKSVEHSMH